MKKSDAYAHFTNRRALEGFLPEEMLKELYDASIEEAKEKWIKTMEKHDIEKVIFLGVRDDNDEFEKFTASDERFIGVSFADLRKGSALEKLKEDVEKRGFRGLAVYPVWHSLDLGDEKYYKIYEYCNEKGLAIIVHFGVSALAGDLRYGNPISLAPVLQKFKKIKWVIAHFGAGYLREALMITYKNENVYFDTSGTNNWLDLMPEGWKLKDVFRIVLKVVGSGRVIWGSDTYKLFEEGYREHYMEKQKRIISELYDEGFINEKGIKDIFYNNAKKVYGI